MTRKGNSPYLSPEVVEQASAIAGRIGVPVSNVVEAGFEASTASGRPRLDAQREIDAYESGSALTLEQFGEAIRWPTHLPKELARNFGIDLDPGYSVPLLFISLGAWVPEAPDPTLPFARHGYGIKIDSYGVDVADSARGYWYVQESPFVRLVALRRGQPRMYALAWDHRQLTSSRRRYFSQMLIAQNGNWINPLAEAEQTLRIDEDDQAVVRALDSIIVRPTGNQNPVKWLS